MTNQVADKQQVDEQLIINAEYSDQSRVPAPLRNKGFKKGQSGNPKGRPKQILSKKQRLQLLSEYAKLNPDKVNPVSAIHEHNLMEHVFDEKPQYQDNRTYNILVQGDEAKDRFNKLLEGKKPQDVVDEESKEPVAPQDIGGKDGN